jgi:hypothetical protein
MKQEQWTTIGRALVEGKIIDTLTLNGKEYKFSDKQAQFICDLDGKNHKFVLFSGGRGCGKSLALVIKMYLVCKCFPGIRVLLGRKNLSDIEKTTLQDFFKVVPSREFNYRVKDGLINFNNGSQIVLLGLDAMQSGDVADMKKAEQKTKSMNLGGYFLDQLEEIEYDVFQKLNDTMRMKAPEGELDYPRQGNMTTNPANFWAYYYFKQNKRMNEDGNWIPKINSDSLLLEGSMLDNRDNLPEDFIQDRLSREESYVRRFVYGEWTTDVLLKGTVFAKEYIRKLELLKRNPIDNKEGCKIYEYSKPGLFYQMGVDPSEGIVDPSSVKVVSSEGKIVASFCGMATIPELADKIKFLYYQYQKPRIIPEVNKSSLLEHIKDLRVYRRKQFDYKTKKETEKLGFVTSWSTKQALITNFQDILRNSNPVLDYETIEEMKTFLWSDQAALQGASAARGFHDDNIIATLLGFWELTPKRVEQIIVNQAQPPIKRVFGYK